MIMSRGEVVMADFKTESGSPLFKQISMGIHN